MTEEPVQHTPTGREELSAALARLQSDLEDLEEAIRFEYTFTVAHIGGRQVRKDEESLSRLRQEIARLQTLLAKAEGPE